MAAGAQRASAAGFFSGTPEGPGPVLPEVYKGGGAGRGLFVKSAG